MGNERVLSPMAMRERCKTWADGSHLAVTGLRPLHPVTLPYPSPPGHTRLIGAFHAPAALFPSRPGSLGVPRGLPLGRPEEVLASVARRGDVPSGSPEKNQDLGLIFPIHCAPP